MKNLRNQRGYWKPCRPGTIFGVSDCKFRRQRRRFLIQAAMGSAVTATALFSGFFIFSHRNRQQQLSDASGGTENHFTPVATSESAISRSERRRPARVKMTCEDVAHHLDAFLLAHQSSPDQRTVTQNDLLNDVASHLQICKSCYQKVQKAVLARKA